MKYLGLKFPHFDTITYIANPIIPRAKNLDTKLMLSTEIFMKLFNLVIVAEVGRYKFKVLSYFLFDGEIHNAGST